jgi:hypothetical protein
VVNNQGHFGEMRPPLKRHLELQMRTLENAPGDADRLERLLQISKDKKKKLSI